MYNYCLIVFFFFFFFFFFYYYYKKKKNLQSFKIQDIINYKDLLFIKI